MLCSWLGLDDTKGTICGAGKWPMICHMRNKPLYAVLQKRTRLLCFNLHYTLSKNRFPSSKWVLTLQVIYRGSNIAKYYVPGPQVNLWHYPHAQWNNFTVELDHLYSPICYTCDTTICDSHHNRNLWSHRSGVCNQKCHRTAITYAMSSKKHILCILELKSQSPLNTIIKV